MITDILIKYEIPADLTDESETVKKLTPIIHTIINNEHFTTLEHLFQYFSAQLISVILNTCGELGISCQKALLNKNRLCRIKRDLIDAYANEYQPQGIFSIQDESQTLASISYQNLFLLYKKLSGMTGTAKTEEAEFEKIYKCYKQHEK